MRRSQNFWHSPATPILILVGLNLIVGLVVFQNFGESWDENGFYVYGQDTLRAYQTVFTAESMRPSLLGPIFNYRFYGPFYVAFSALFANIGHGIFPAINAVDFWHLSYFLSFQLALVSLYFICLRWVSTPTALAATLLFNSQPLLWGHAFINPKDIPFLGFFLASVWSGLWMVDRLGVARKTAELPSLGSYWQTAIEPMRLRVVKFGVGAALLAALIVWLPLYTWTAAWAHSAEENPATWSFYLLQRLAPNLGSIPLDSYLGKFALQVPEIKAAAVVLLFALLLAAVIAGLPGLGTHLAVRTREGVHWLRPMLVAGTMLGMTGAIRVFAPVAGGITAMYLLYRLRGRGLICLALYLAIAGVVMYMFWPFLWTAPISRFAASLNEMSNFPKDIGVLFNGVDVRSTQLPMGYLPTLITVQLTLPALILALIGGSLAVWDWGNLKEKLLLLLMAAWFVLPVAAVMALHPTLYDNFRQLLFIVPPVFILGAIALEALWKHVSPKVYVTVLLALLAPGLIAMVKLHPYEYMYYNALVGGVEGAEGRFELDYWATSYRETIYTVNEVAPENAAIYVHGPDHMLRHFGRPDLVAVYEVNSQQSGSVKYDYAILTTRFTTDKVLFPDGKEIYTVSREGAVLSVVKRLERGQ